MDVSFCSDSGDLEFRLSGDLSESRGRLQVHYNGEWGRVCGAEFGSNEALVACRSLGFESLLLVDSR